MSVCVGEVIWCPVWNANFNLLVLTATQAMDNLEGSSGCKHIELVGEHLPHYLVNL